MKTKYTKAQDVEQVYDTAAWDDNICSEGCYSLAIAAAHEFGGVEIYNSNDGQSRGISFAPTRTFTFDDESSAQISYGGVFVICWEYKPLDKCIQAVYHANHRNNKLFTKPLQARRFE